MATNIDPGPGREVVARAKELVGQWVVVWRTQEAIDRDSGLPHQIVGLLARIDAYGIKLSKGLSRGETYLRWADVDAVEHG